MERDQDYNEITQYEAVIHRSNDLGLRYTVNRKAISVNLAMYTFPGTHMVLKRKVKIW